MKKLLKYLKEYKKESILAPLFKMLEAMFDLLVPLVMASIINTGIANGDKSYILTRCGLLILLGIIGLACSITAQYFAAKAAVGFSAKLRHALFAHIQSLGFSEMDKLGTSTLITRMTSDINQVQSGLNLFLRLFLRSPFIVFGSVVMAFLVSARAAVIFVVTIPLLSVVVLGSCSGRCPCTVRYRAVWMGSWALPGKISPACAWCALLAERIRKRSDLSRAMRRWCMDSFWWGRFLRL